MYFPCYRFFFSLLSIPSLALLQFIIFNAHNKIYHNEINLENLFPVGNAETIISTI